MEEEPEDTKVPLKALVEERAKRQEDEAKLKEIEEKVRPTLMKLYQGAADDFKAAGGGESAAPGPRVEEVD